jgi:hypothetical protein
MRDIEAIAPPITHEKFKVFFDGIGQDIQEVQKMHEKHNDEMELFCFETKLVIADAMKRFRELAFEMD